MTSLCLTGDGLSASLFAAALHFGWTPADGSAREESWHVHERRFDVVCGEVWCVPLEKLLPRSRAAVVEIAPC